MNAQKNEVTAQPIYIIQVNPNVHSVPQAIQLHRLENLSGMDNLIIPLHQQKHGQHLLLIEPLTESTKISYAREKEGNSITPHGTLPDTKTERCEANQMEGYVQIQNSSKERVDNVIANYLIKCKNTDTEGSDFDKAERAQSYINDTRVENTSIPKQKIKNYVHISDVKAPPRAIAVLPAPLQIRGSYISPRRTLPVRARFGPVQGIRRTITRLEAQILLSNKTTPVFLLRQDEDHVIYIDVSDKDKSNWMGLLPLGVASDPTTANLWLYEENNELYALTTQPICARKPLRLGYSKKYVEEHNIPSGPPVLDLETVNPVQWRCNECNRALSSAALLHRHMDVYHNDYIRSSRCSYRCRYCKRSFGRLFTLKRHMHSNCTKKPGYSPEKTPQPTERNEDNEPDINSVLEDNRMPSDESFQNFTNSLDFSTNLFDTDRIAGLDISNNSRPDSELNPYAIGFKDDNALSNDLGFSKFSNDLENVQTKQDQEEQPLDTCTYCCQVIARENKIKHLRQCPSRLICECGRVFRRKRSLAQHIYKYHPHVKLEKPVNEKPEANEKDMAYKCQECPMGFKRRGMLVNHLWRVHKMISTMPVEKKVRHYPCVACSKIYRSASKRDRHVRAHHPGTGVDKFRGQWIEGGVKSCQPASCTECPRQYASRAKLLQHVRQQHPLLAKTMKTQAMKKQTSEKTDCQNKEAAETTSQERIIYSTNPTNVLLSWKAE